MSEKKPIIGMLCAINNLMQSDKAMPFITNNVKKFIKIMKISF